MPLEGNRVATFTFPRGLSEAREKQQKILRDFLQDQLAEVEEEVRTAKDKAAAREKLAQLRVHIAMVRSNEMPFILGLRKQLEDFRRQYKGKPVGSNPTAEAQYARNLRELAAAEWEAEQP